MQELQDRVAKAKVLNEDLTDVGREIVDFHGEMVLLVNYSTLNYTGNFVCLLAVNNVSNDHTILMFSVKK